MQTGLNIANGKATGTLKYYAEPSSAIVTRWGAGNFIVVNLADNDFTGLTSVKIGMNPSQGSGLQEIINDPDKNGVFKVTDASTQKFVVESTDGTYTKKQEIDLSDLTCEPEGEG